MLNMQICMQKIKDFYRNNQIFIDSFWHTLSSAYGVAIMGQATHIISGGFTYAALLALCTTILRAIIKSAWLTLVAWLAMKNTPPV
jgi:hypothetical protein